MVGNTHRMGVASYTSGFGGTAAKTLTGMEIGTLMDRKLARPLGGQQGFGRLTIEGRQVTAEIVPFSVTERFRNYR